MMILLDIFFDILPNLILASGVCIFGGMGTGTQSGKLTFKKIFSGNGISISEDSSSLSICDTSTGGVAIDSCEIVRGDSVTGITGSSFCIDTAKKRIVGNIRIISGTNSPSSYSLCAIDGYQSLILGGKCNYLQGDYWTIIGGYKNDAQGFDASSTIIGGRGNIFKSAGSSAIVSSNCSKGSLAYCDTIIGGFCNCFCTNSKFSTIISGKRNTMVCTCYSSSINSTATFSSISSDFSKFSTVISSTSSNIRPGFYTTDISNNQSSLSDPNPYSSNNTLLSNLKPEIIKSSNSSLIATICSCIPGASFSSIISTSKGIIHNVSRYSSIISGNQNVISGSSFSFIGSSDNSCIIDSNRSIILSSSGTIKCSNSSLVISGKCSCIIDSNYSILSSRYDSSSKSVIKGSSFSTAIFQIYGSICNSNHSFLFGFTYNQICCGKGSAILGYNTNFIYGPKETKYSAILNDKNGNSSPLYICSSTSDSCFNFLSSGSCNTINGGIGSSIISSYLTSISYISRNSSIVGSQQSCIQGSTNSVIIGGYKNVIVNSRNSAIIAGMPGSVLSGYCETTRTGHIQIIGTMGVLGVSNAKTYGIGYCNMTSAPTSITVCRGIILSIS
jgi:hypothetical protein